MYHSELQKYSPVYPDHKKETASHRYRECVEITDSHGRTQFDAGSGIYSDDACSCFSDMSMVDKLRKYFSFQKFEKLL